MCLLSSFVSLEFSFSAYALKSSILCHVLFVSSFLILSCVIELSVGGSDGRTARTLGAEAKRGLRKVTVNQKNTGRTHRYNKDAGQ